MAEKPSCEFSECSTIKVRAFQPDDLDSVLELIRVSDATDRTEETWNKNNMTAMLAFDQEQLIGLIPFEKRKVVFCKEEKLNVLWVSGAHVHPEYRGKGIGSMMDWDIEKYFTPEFDALLVCREDETSRAYQWYKRLGYQQQTPIISFCRPVEQSTDEVSDYIVWDTKEQVLGAGEKLFQCFQSNIGDRGGFPERSPQFWADQWESHYYKASYRYCIVAIFSNDAVIGYAMLGETEMKDGITRFDILEIMGQEDEASKKNLYNAIRDLAHKRNLKEVRIQLVEQDQDIKLIESLGFTERWRTNILGKRIALGDALPSIHWKYFHIDYI